MVLFHVKRGDESQFLYQTEVEKPVNDVVKDIVAIFNGRLKVTRICHEMEELADHGTFLPLEMQGLTEEQVSYILLLSPNKYRLVFFFVCSRNDFVLKSIPNMVIATLYFRRLQRHLHIIFKSEYTRANRKIIAPQSTKISSVLQIISDKRT